MSENVTKIHGRALPYLSDHDQEMIARAFGFTSAHHMGNVCAGREPSALESAERFQRRRARRAAAVAAFPDPIDVQLQEYDREKREQRRENHRAARLAVVERKKAEAS